MSAVSSRAIVGQFQRDRLQLIDRGEMDDQRIDRRALFGAEDALDGGGVGRVRAQAVDRLGGEGDQPARAQNFGGGLRSASGSG